MTHAGVEAPAGRPGLSSSEKADDPVIAGLSQTLPSACARITGCPAFAGHDRGDNRAADYATAARSGVVAAATDRRSSRSVRQKAEPPLRRNEGSGVVTTR